LAARGLDTLALDRPNNLVTSTHNSSNAVRLESDDNRPPVGLERSGFGDLGK